MSAPEDGARGAVADAVAHLPGATLADLGGDSLMDRADRRFVLPLRVVPDLLARCRGYRALEIGTRRIGAYGTVYFDTPDLRFYHEHHSGRTPRYKVRLRRYLETGDRFAEIKRRTAGGRTTKCRVAVADDLDGAGIRAAVAALPDAPADLPTELVEAVAVSYGRITLAAPDGRERVTLDFDVRFRRADADATFPDLVIVEVKQERPRPSPFLGLLRDAGVREGGMSKYCLGVVSLIPGVRAHRFSRSLSRLRRITDAADPAARTLPS